MLYTDCPDPMMTAADLVHVNRRNMGQLIDDGRLAMERIARNSSPEINSLTTDERHLMARQHQRNDVDGMSD
jgi:hypothetical protein